MLHGMLLLLLVSFVLVAVRAARGEDAARADASVRNRVAPARRSVDAG
jgi:hypothetical protein